MDPLSALLAGAALHAGFQAVVTAVVYPALAAAAAAPGWARVHAAHSRRIAPVVAVVYASVLATWAWVLLVRPLTGWLVLAAAGSALAGLSTALVAAPVHARLGREGPRPALLRRLRRADGVRLAGALLGLAGAAGAVPA
ncbi:hypothetical protein [Kineococcus auxinigenes]|uniref:hypothetical protein n=1 Tax=unclassified Kineococcus TaxID=2621656 RepID=UPI003D7E45AA